MISSGSAVSANAVKPRRSRNTTVISRRWLLSGSSAPPLRISSASCGREEALEAGQALELLDLLGDALLQRAVRLLELGVERLDPQQRAHPRQQLGLVDRLGEEIVGAGFDALDTLFAGVECGDHHHRQDPPGGSFADAPAHLVAGHARHHDVEQDQVGLGVRHLLERFGAGGCGDDLVAFYGEQIRQQLDVARRVVDDEDLRGSAHAGPRPLPPPRRGRAGVGVGCRTRRARLQYRKSPSPFQEEGWGGGRLPARVERTRGTPIPAFPLKGGRSPLWTCPMAAHAGMHNTFPSPCQNTPIPTFPLKGGRGAGAAQRAETCVTALTSPTLAPAHPTPRAPP